MRVLTCVLAAGLLAATCACGQEPKNEGDSKPDPKPAADLSKIARTIIKEPAYQGKPTYCLLVFGPEAKTRIWLVVDGNILYVDRNGNGDLTETGERIEGTPLFDRPGPAGRLIGISFGVEKLTKWDGKDTRLMVVANANRDEDDVVNVFVGEEAFQNTAASEPSGLLKFSTRSQDAPVIHFGGALQMAPRAQHTLMRTDKAQTFQAMIGTPGLGKGTFAAVNIGMVPKDIHPVAEFEFPNKRTGENPLKATVTLSQRC
jgi:hypothetical protein